MFEKYINLTSVAPVYLAQFALVSVFAIYFLRLKNKSKETRIYLVWLFFEVHLYSGLFLTSALSTKSDYSLVAGIYLLVASFLDNLMWALMPYYLGKNYFPKERVIMTGVLTGLYLCAEILVVVYGYNNVISQSIFILVGIYVPIVFFRKMKMAAKHNDGKRTERVMYGFFIVSILAVINVFFGEDYFATPSLVVILLFNLTNLANSLYANFTFINYSQERNSLVAKLVGVVLCSLLILLGLIPILILDQGKYFDAKATQKILRTFTLAIPVTGILTVSLIPILFRYGFLNPFKKVAAAVEKINRGDLSIQLDVEVNDEIGQMVTDVNGMAKSLQIYSGNLEQLVERRTHELQDSLNKLKAAQAQLIQSEKMASLGELTAGIAHEIQNPLNFVNNFSELSAELLDEMNEELEKGDVAEAKFIAADIKQNLEKINHHGKRADSIVRGMLEHSRTSSGVKEPTDINKMCDEFVRLAFHGIRAKDKFFNADLVTAFDPSVGMVEIVGQDIGRVILNLVNNAFYAVNERAKNCQSAPPELGVEDYKPAVTITTKREANTVSISVADNGNGIPDKIKDKIFNPFFTTKPTGLGTGLGLSLSYDIVKAHGGELKVESKEGEGTSFIIQLPV